MARKVERTNHHAGFWLEGCEGDVVLVCFELLFFFVKQCRHLQASRNSSLKSRAGFVQPREVGN